MSVMFKTNDLVEVLPLQCWKIKQNNTYYSSRKWY